MIPLGLVAFAMLGVVLVLLGATADALRESLDLSLQQFGLLGSAFAAGMFGGVVGAGPLVDRFPRRPIFLGATLLTAAALACVDDAISYPSLVVCTVALGLGAGIYDTLLNAVTAEYYADRAVRMLAMLHASVTIGAIGAPLAIEAMLARGSFARVFEVTAYAFLALSLWVAFVPLPDPHGRAAAGAHPRLLTPAFAALCALGFCYVGVESGLVLFAVPYAAEGLGIGADSGRASISAFWFGVLAARGALALPVFERTASMHGLAAAGLASAVLLLVGTGFGWSALPWLLAAQGAVIGSIFPVMIAAAARWNPGSAGVAAGFVAGAGSLGAITVPWSTGALGDILGVRIGFASIAVWCGLLAVSAWLADRLHRRAPATRDIQTPVLESPS